jgi:exodeoxyribonuclease VII small subunit
MPPRKKADDNVAAIDFEKSLDQLTKLVERMERGNLPLEESLKYFEQGVGLIRECQTALTHAEQKVQILTQQQGMDILKSYQSDNDHDD